MRPPLLFPRARAAARSLALALAAAACGSVLDGGGCGGNGATCPFAVRGHAVVTGTVVGARAQPVAGATVYARDAGATSLAGGVVATDPAGAFRLDLRSEGSRPPAAGPDTTSLWVFAFDPATVQVGAPPRVRDSLLVRVTLAPPGTAPTPASARLTLPVP